METTPNFFFFSFPTVKRCLQGIKAILPKEIAVQMLVKWYNAYNAPGGPSYHSEWNLFVTCLMNMMGYNTERLSWTRNVSKLICLFSWLMLTLLVILQGSKWLETHRIVSELDCILS